MLTGDAIQSGRIEVFTQESYCLLCNNCTSISSFHCILLWDYHTIHSSVSVLILFGQPKTTIRLRNHGNSESVCYLGGSNAAS